MKKKHGNKDCEGCGTTTEHGIEFCSVYEEY